MIRPRNSAILGFTIGLVAGAVAWSTVQHTYRKDLFNRNPLRRFVALGHLTNNPSVATVQLLREFIAWERHPSLRARAVRMLRDVEKLLT